MDALPDPKVWQSQAKRALRCFLSNTTDEQKLDYLLMHLTDAAYVWAESKDFKTVAGFELSFSERFVWESTATVMQNLAVLKQKKGQSVTELADEVRQLASYVKEYLTAMMVRAYIEGLEDPGLREVLGARPVSLETAEEAAKYFVSYAQPKEMAKEEKKVKEETEVEKITKQLEQLTMQLTQMQQGRGPGILPRPGGGAGGGFKCYQCGKEGHMARECPNKGRATMNMMQQLVEKSRPAMTIAEFLNGEEGGVDMLVGERKWRAVRDPEGWGIDEAREELRKKLADGTEEAKGSRFVRGKARISSLPTSYNVVDQLKLTPVSASVWNYIKDSDKVRKELIEALKKGEEEKEEGTAPMQGVAKIVAAAPVEVKEKEAPRASNLVFQIPQCDVYLGKHRVTAIVDSGASQTALSHVIARKLGLLPYLQDTTIEFTTSSGDTSKPWGILPDVPVRVGKLTLPVDIAVTGANTYDMLLGQDWIYSANADILTSKGKIVYQVNTKETDSVPITTGPMGVGGRPSSVLLPSHTTHRNINEEDEEHIKAWMEEADFLKWMEERRIAMEEEGRTELNAEKEEEYYLWLREQEEEEQDEASSGEESEEEELEEKEHEGEGNAEEAWGYDFGSPTANKVGAWASGGMGIDWDQAYDEMVEKYVGEEDEVDWEVDSMADGEEYLDQDWEDGELIYDRKRKPISTDHLFEIYNYPAAEKWNYVAAESGDEGRIILGSYYTLKKEAPRVACPAFEDLPVSLNHELEEQQQKEVRTLLVEYREVFSTEKETLGTHPTIRHHIATGSAKPIAHKSYRPDGGKLEAISNMAAPVDQRGVREFLGCTSYYRRFIKGYAKVAHPLTQLLHKDHPFEWTHDYPIPMYTSLFPKEQGEDEGESSESVTKGEKEEDSKEEDSTEEEEEADKGDEEDNEEEEENSTDKEEEDKEKGGEVEEESSGEEEGEETGEEEEIFEEGQRPDEGIEEEQLLEEIGQPKKKAKVEGEAGEEGTPSKNLASETTLDIWDDANTLFFLEKGTVDPAWSTAEKRRVRARGKNFEWRDGRLLKKIKGELKPVPRKEERRDIIAFLHGLGHLGVPRTTDLVKKQYDWYGVGSDVAAFVKGCATCVFQKGAWTAKGELQLVLVSKPWERVVIDFIGPLHTTAKGGNKYVISAMDHFTKWPECKPVRSADAATAAAFVAEKIISNHGCPLVIHTDNGASIHSSTKFSPFFLQYGRHPNITGTTMSDFEVRELSELSTEEEADAVAGYLYRRSSEMELVLAQAVGNHDKAQEKQKLDFDLRRTTALEMEKLEKGDFVRLKPSKRVAWEKQAKKFKTLFKVKEVEQFDVVVEDKAGASWKESRENVKLVKIAP
ncbi:unnamed protein product [Closterium sp. Naga37s-1]|nr:unnamed protein product [Closterium sp. Naga37s-1]